MRFSLQIVFLFLFLSLETACAQKNATKQIIVGAEQPGSYLPGLQGKKVGLLVNQSSLVFGEHLIDFLLKNNINVKSLFAAEHGIRGEAEAGEQISDNLDVRSGLPIISLYGKDKKPTKAQLAGLDVVVFDIQDVGCRFYTYISTMHYMMEACAGNNVTMLILDRPNPNGDYVAGPVLQPAFTSFVGMHPIPVVHGCTVGEMALMINGEGWLADKRKVDLKVVPVLNYTHLTHYSLPVKPSPNLPNDLAIRLYPSLCFFEATNVSIGRGTEFPFQVIGYPDASMGLFSFTPRSIEGMSKNPLHEGIACFGIDLRRLDGIPNFTLRYLIDFYSKINSRDKFWKSKRWMELLSGNSELYEQINLGETEETITKTWQIDLAEYKLMRKKYLLYTDFEP